MRLRILFLLVGLAAAEALLQVATAVFPPVEARLSGLKPRYVVDPALYVRGDPTLPEYDEAGFRNEARPERADIVAIGDSQTEGSGVARENAWPQQLARHLGLTVYQTAFGSYGPGHYLELVDDALTLRPDTVIVALYTGNDLAGAYDWVYERERNPELRTGDAERLAELWSAERERGPIDRPWRITRDAEKGLHDRPILGWVRTTLDEHSKIVALFDQIQWRISGGGDNLDIDAGPRDWDETMAALENVPRDILYPFDDGGMRTVFTPRARLAAQDLGDARIAEGLRITLAALERIAAACRDRARLLVLLMPTKEMVYADLVRGHATDAPQAFVQLLAAESEVRARIREGLAERGIATIDPLTALRAALGATGTVHAQINPYPENWDGHPSAAGYTAVKETVVSALSRPPA